MDNISIRKYITYVKNKNNIYIFRSSDTNIRSNATALPEKFDEILPPFFTEIRKEDRFIIKILKIKHDSWVFMSTNTPILFVKIQIVSANFVSTTRGA
jgi:hypothetical protein